MCWTRRGGRGGVRVWGVLGGGEAPLWGELCPPRAPFPAPPPQGAFVHTNIVNELPSPFWQGAFVHTNTLNYHAILDTALDVAKAMCHLHAMNVLHSDLKVWFLCDITHMSVAKDLHSDDGRAALRP